jgi:hypothetical protein
MGDGAAYYFSETPYDWSDRPAGAGEYRYAPAFLWLVAPLRLLPWEAFAALWFAAHVVVLLYLRVPWMLAFPGVIDDAVRGNINVFLALALVLIVQRAAAPLWGAAFLTKVTPWVTVAWHLGRREFRQFGIALAFSVAITGFGVWLEPALWSEWFASLVVGPETYPATVALVVSLPLRVALGACLALYAARADRPWLLPIAFLVAMPGLWPNSFALLVATVVLVRRERQGELESVAMAGVVWDAIPVSSSTRVPSAAAVEIGRANSSSSIRK